MDWIGGLLIWSDAPPVIALAFLASLVGSCLVAGVLPTIQIWTTVAIAALGLCFDARFFRKPVPTFRNAL